MLKKILFALQLTLTLLMCAFLLIPVGMSILAGLSVNYFRGPSAGLTFRWVIQVWQDYHDAILNSLYVGLSTLVLVTLLGVPAGYVLARWKSRMARWIEELLTLPIALPGLASALALISVYGGMRGFRESLAFIVVGHVIFTLPFMVRAVAAACADSRIKLMEEGAASLGASFLRRFTTVVLPNIRSEIVAAALIVITLSLGEFNLTWMLHTPDTKTLPVGLADAYASLRLEIGSAYTAVFFVLIVPLLIVMQMTAQRAKSTNGKNSARGRT
ncbi:ABC transporter permease [Pandoraea pnomenusa]|uniref:ABC transporter permease n=1 Tax=Pandoraea pnomenusa TaxID=93220 RepID=A0ABY6WMV0_9BURK|nr:ABC transporter permease subunit [Pandoraea pnomenusa]AHB05166.1 ABC transporter permease [Pandoraea pnomenusa 3kgm]AHN77198.1 ABC transporter permease [Pandoraea pnomenusa]VVE68650.1 ABC transporter permease [Pandoraea pnomenusa]